MRSITTIIFDLDGTLANTEPLWAASTRAILAENGINISDEEHHSLNRRIRGKSIIECMKTIKEIFNLVEEPERLEDKMVDYFELFRDGIQRIQDSEKFIEMVKERYKIAIASNSNRYTMMKTVEKLLLQKYFGDHTYSKDDVMGKAKPHPDVFLHAAKMVGSEVRDCLVIEDSETGVTAAKNAGMFCIAVNTSGMPDKLTKADMIVNDFGELIEKFDNYFI
jgi:HAD superfamily hydrolase (TIGR01509 family)